MEDYQYFLENRARLDQVIQEEEAMGGPIDDEEEYDEEDEIFSELDDNNEEEETEEPEIEEVPEDIEEEPVIEEVEQEPVIEEPIEEVIEEPVIEEIPENIEEEPEIEEVPEDVEEESEILEEEEDEDMIIKDGKIISSTLEMYKGPSGVLYFDMKSYIDEWLKDKNLSEEVKDHITDYIAQMKKLKELLPEDVDYDTLVRRLAKNANFDIEFNENNPNAEIEFYNELTHILQMRENGKSGLEYDRIGPNNINSGNLVNEALTQYVADCVYNKKYDKNFEKKTYDSKDLGMESGFEVESDLTDYQAFDELSTRYIQTKGLNREDAVKEAFKADEQVVKNFWKENPVIKEKDNWNINLNMQLIYEIDKQERNSEKLRKKLKSGESIVLNDFNSISGSLEQQKNVYLKFRGMFDKVLGNDINVDELTQKTKKNNKSKRGRKAKSKVNESAQNDNELKEEQWQTNVNPIEKTETVQPVEVEENLVNREFPEQNDNSVVNLDVQQPQQSVNLNNPVVEEVVNTENQEHVNNIFQPAVEENVEPVVKEVADTQQDTNNMFETTNVENFEVEPAKEVESGIDKNQFTEMAKSKLSILNKRKALEDIANTKKNK